MLHLSRAGMLEAKRDYEGAGADIPITIFKAGATRSMWAPFEIEAVGVNHSIPSNVLVIRTPLGNIVHTAIGRLMP